MSRMRCFAVVGREAGKGVPASCRTHCASYIVWILSKYEHGGAPITDTCSLVSSVLRCTTSAYVVPHMRGQRRQSVTYCVSCEFGGVDCISQRRGADLLIKCVTPLPKQAMNRPHAVYIIYTDYRLVHRYNVHLFSYSL
jgi:hypothetical protein